MPHGRPNLRSRLHSCHVQEGGTRSPLKGHVVALERRRRRRRRRRRHCYTLNTFLIFQLNVHLFYACFYYISPTCFAVLYKPSSGRTSYCFHKTIRFLLRVLYVTLLCYRIQHIHICRYKIFFYID